MGIFAFRCTFLRAYSASISLHLIAPPKLQIYLECLTYVWLKLAVVYRMVVLSKLEAIEAIPRAYLELIRFERRFDIRARVRTARESGVKALRVFIRLGFKTH